jgi:hypothetical protein
MFKFTRVVGIVSVIAAVAAPLAAQTPESARAAADQRQARYQVGAMERVLEAAVEHGATVIRDRVQAFAPTEMILLDAARVRGFRLEGYGVFFDVTVPSFEWSTLWSLRTLDQNNLGLESALGKIKAYVEHSSDADVQQAFKRIELQVAPVAVAQSRLAPGAAGARNAVGSAATVNDQAAGRSGAAPRPDDNLLSDPNEAYRTEVMQALQDAMLDHGAPLHIGSDEWLTIAARGDEERTRLAPADTNKQTIVVRLRGADLSAFLSGQLTREEALKRIERKVF